MNFVKDAAAMPDLTVGINTFPVMPGFIPALKSKTLYPLDYQIIQSLRDNSRKATSEVADELSVSAKTVRRRLSRMMKDHLIELSMEWYPDVSNDIISLIHLRVKPQTDKNTMNRILRKYAPNMVFYWGFSNLPDTFIAMVWTNTMKPSSKYGKTWKKKQTCSLRRHPRTRHSPVRKILQNLTATSQEDRDMKTQTPIDAAALLKEAEASEHKEAYRTLERNPNYRIGVGVRLIPPNPPNFFVEILIYLCPSFSNADLDALERSLTCLKELKGRNYALTCQDGNCISCEASLPKQRLAEEYADVKALMKNSFS
ncbi:AsnC family protein [Candidatus Bathyarchaeota archaeon A05DMB-2]|nr:AsnC family protein [Candidatus Bathyarchaeota archaeon A05DMB-2]